MIIIEDFVSNLDIFFDAAVDASNAIRVFEGRFIIIEGFHKISAYPVGLIDFSTSLLSLIHRGAHHEVSYGQQGGFTMTIEESRDFYTITDRENDNKISIDIKDFISDFLDSVDRLSVNLEKNHKIKEAIFLKTYFSLF